MSRIEVPKCINETKFHVEISDEKGTNCSTKYVSTGEILPGWLPYQGNKTYIFKEWELENCTSTFFDTKKLGVMIEAKKTKWPFTNFQLCENMVSRGLMKIFMDDGSTYISADHFWKYETNLHNFKFTISLGGQMVDRKLLDSKLFVRTF